MNKKTKKINVMFHVSTNIYGSQIQEEVEIEHEAHLIESDIDKLINEHYVDWLTNNTDQSYWIIDEPNKH